MLFVRVEDDGSLPIGDLHLPIEKLSRFILIMLLVSVEDDGSLPFEATDSSLHSSLGRDHFDAVQHSQQTFCKTLSEVLR